MTGEVKAVAPAHHHIVVMGVTSCGKSTVGVALAARIGAEFIDGDSLHPEANINKMASGTPLDDNDRAPWLAEISRRFSASDSGLVIACSALKRTYRDIIRTSDPPVIFVHLYGSRELLAGRMSARPGHFMPLALLDSQLDILEDLQADETGIIADVSTPVAEIVDKAVAALPDLPISKLQN